MRRLAQFDNHPISFRQAQTLGGYRGVVNAIIDGDTYSIVLDAGFYVYPVIEVRLQDVNTPEIVGTEHEQGIAAREYVRSILEQKPVFLKTQLDATGQDKMSFVRYVAEVYVATMTALGNHIESVAVLIQRAGFDKLHPLPLPSSARGSHG